MPYLFCEKHGREHEADAIAAQDAYRQEGESVVVVEGTLISGPWQCDRGTCGAPLRKGARANLATAYPAWIVERTHEYDFASEKRYFAIEKAEVAVYGARWPEGMLTLRRPQLTNSADDS